MKDPAAPRLLVVSPVRNEAAHIGRVLDAMAAQDLPPARWIVVDDASTDDTLAVLHAREPRVPFLTVVARKPADDLDGTADRLSLAAEVRAFNAGLAHAGELADYTHIMKLDGDIELPPNYFRDLLDAFASDPSLGLAGGVLVEDVDGQMVPIRIAPEHVHGALKCYSAACFAAIGGMPEYLGWDTIDAVTARMHGYATRHLPELVGIHHRPLGSADGTLRGHARHGECAYLTHYPAYWVVARSTRVGRRRPRVLSGLAFVGGYARAAVRRPPRVGGPELRRFVRRELRTRAWREATGAVRIRVGSPTR